MIYIVAGAVGLICIAAIIFGFKVLRENRKMLVEKSEPERSETIPDELITDEL